MRDPNPFDQIVKVLRELWSRSPDASIAQLIHSAADPAVENEIRDLSDAQLLHKLRAMAHFTGAAPHGLECVNVEHLSALDQARDYDAASSYNWLREELRRLRAIVSGGCALRVEDESGFVVLASRAEFDAWAKRRYPSA